MPRIRPLHDFHLQAFLTEEPCLCRQVGYGMSYDSGSVADANFLPFRLCLSARGTGDGQKKKEDAADAGLHVSTSCFP